jgi:hypothetical protein
MGWMDGWNGGLEKSGLLALGLSPFTFLPYCVNNRNGETRSFTRLIRHVQYLIRRGCIHYKRCIKEQNTILSF